MEHQCYSPVFVTAQDGEPIAAIIDIDAFQVVSATLDQLQLLRSAGTLTTPAAWLQMRGEMVADGYAREACEVAA